MAAFYPILDCDLARSRGHDPLRLAAEIAGLGLPWLQLRAKTLPAGEFLELAERMQAALAERGGRTRLIVNDRADIAALSHAAGLHLGQDDLPLAAARRLLPPAALIGFSTHNPSQIRAALAQDAALAGAADPIDDRVDDRAAAAPPSLRALAYLAFGPVFPTATKSNPDPVTSLEGLRQARALFRGPLVAIGGIGRENCRAAAAAGADYVAVISAWLSAGDPLAETRAFLLALAESPVA